MEVLTSLVILELSLNDIANVEPLAALLNLGQLWLDNNEIQVGSVLTPLTNLYVLTLKFNDMNCDEQVAVKTAFPFAILDNYWDDPDDGDPVSIYCF